MRRPAGVPDAQIPFDGVGFEQSRQAFADFPLLLAELQFIPVQHRDAGAVIAAIFQPPQSFQQDGRC